MWMPSWLGEAYAKLYVSRGDEVFNFAVASDILSLNKGMVKATLSGLHKRGVLAIFSRGRPRLYRLISPDLFVLMASCKMKRLDLKQERYLSPIYNCFLHLSELLRLTSFAVYGSVARGTAMMNSDLDFMVISQDFKGSLAERIDLLSNVKIELKEDLDLLRRYGVMTPLSFYPLREEEVVRLPIILLDIMEEAKITYDEDDFLYNNLTRLRLKLAELGAKRISIGDRWYWDLKPGYKPLEVVPL